MGLCSMNLSKGVLGHWQHPELRSRLVQQSSAQVPAGGEGSQGREQSGGGARETRVHNSQEVLSIAFVRSSSGDFTASGCSACWYCGE